MKTTNLEHQNLPNPQNISPKTYSIIQKIPNQDIKEQSNNNMKLLRKFQLIDEDLEL
jgi:hypothetical protein